MSVIQFPKSDNSSLGDMLSRSSQELAQKDPPQWVHLQLRAHVVRQAEARQRAADAAISTQVPAQPAVLALGAANVVDATGGAGDIGDSNQPGDGPIDFTSWGIVLAVLLGALALLVGSGHWPQGKVTDSTMSSPFESAPKRASTVAEEEFIPVATPQRWRQIVPRRNQKNPDTSAAQAWVVAAELSSDQLARFGLPFDPARAAEPVRAELLLHSSGEILAVRFDH